MKTFTTEMIRHLNKIGQQTLASHSELNSKDPNQSFEAHKKQYQNWKLGIIISFIPILTPIILSFLLCRFNTLPSNIWNIFGDPSIIFIGISATITAANDHLANQYESFILITVGSLIYGLLTAINVFVTTGSNTPTVTMVIFNIIYLCACFILNIKSYKSILLRREHH